MTVTTKEFRIWTDWKGSKDGLLEQSEVGVLGVLKSVNKIPKEENSKPCFTFIKV